MMISMVAAMAENRVIGKDNKMPWHLPADLKHFKAVTLGKPVVMGRKTFESVGSKPLTGRTNIIISRQEGLTSQYDNVWFATSLDEAIEHAKKLETKEIMIAGGAQIYKQALPIANRIYLTRVHVHLDADAFFPEFAVDEWHLTRSSDFEANEKHAYSFSIQQWDRKSGK